MQSTLNKVRSLDYTDSVQRSRGASKGKQLMHSVSIVVELAGKEPQLSGKADAALTVGQKDDEEKYDDDDDDEEEDDERDQFEADELSSKQFEEDDEEEEEDPDADGCLSSSLARRVVIVDEADKIIRSRAHSTEPDEQPELSSPDLSSPSLSLSLSAARQRGFSMDASELKQRVCSFERGVLSSPLGAPRSWAPPVPPRAKDLHAATCSSGGKDLKDRRFPVSLTHTRKSSHSGELAEHGELAKLSMRRNTHHFADSINQGAFAVLSESHLTGMKLKEHRETEVGAERAPRCGAASAGAAPIGSAQLERRLDPLLTKSVALENRAARSGSSSSGGVTSRGCGVAFKAQAAERENENPEKLTGDGWRSALEESNLSQEKNNNRNWSQRRQSLQISLLAGSARKQSSGTNPSKSLTEEELRGEREFNEQVRSVKSPDLLGKLQQPNLATTTTTNLTKTSTTTPAQATASESRSKSADKSIGSSLPVEQQLALTGRLLSPIGKTSPNEQRHPSPRRVSFSSIDPVLVASAATKHPISRASFAFPSPSPSQSTTTGLLKQTQQEQTSELAVGQEDSRFPYSKANSYTSPQPYRFKRHSLAFTANPQTTTTANQQAADQLKKQTILRRNFSQETSSHLPAYPSSSKETLRKMNEMQKDTNNNDNLLDESISSAEAKMESHLSNSNLIATTVHVTEAPTGPDCSRVQSIMASAKLRQEEFARLLEEHEQIVNEINRVETKISSSQTNLQQNQQQNTTNETQ